MAQEKCVTVSLCAKPGGPELQGIPRNTTNLTVSASRPARREVENKSKKKLDHRNASLHHQKIFSEIPLNRCSNTSRTLSLVIDVQTQEANASVLEPWLLEFTWKRTPEHYEVGEIGWSSVGVHAGTLSGAYSLTDVSLFLYLHDQRGLELINPNLEQALPEACTVEDPEVDMRRRHQVRYRHHMVGDLTGSRHVKGWARLLSSLLPLKLRGFNVELGAHAIGLLLPDSHSQYCSIFPPHTRRRSDNRLVGRPFVVHAEAQNLFRVRAGDFYQCESEHHLLLTSPQSALTAFRTSLTASNEPYAADNLSRPVSNHGIRVILSTRNLRLQAFSDYNDEEFTGSGKLTRPSFVFAHTALLTNPPNFGNSWENYSYLVILLSHFYLFYFGGSYRHFFLAGVICKEDIHEDHTVTLAFGATVCVVVAISMVGLMITRLREKDRDLQAIDASILKTKQQIILGRPVNRSTVPTERPEDCCPPPPYRECPV
ncbi:unnamed protein product [Schistocephalus solidus]|uniref:DOMON domain-containing protein n=1 Tax=Schistocephalus solidus TaxID=70667 RepID=A0A183SJV0_SCHSO|nr:unnamed protein product [Schistocephalus solidus]